MCCVNLSYVLNNCYTLAQENVIDRLFMFHPKLYRWDGVKEEYGGEETQCSRGENQSVLVINLYFYGPAHFRPHIALLQEHEKKPIKYCDYCTCY